MAETMKFRTFGGQIVTFTPNADNPSGFHGRWKCAGCGVGPYYSMEYTRDKANEHARECHAMGED